MSENTNASKPAPLSPSQAESMAAWDIAAHYGIGYSGDMNPVEHGGYFYAVKDWEDYDYASCVEFWEDPDNGSLVVQKGTINRPSDPETMEGAFSCIGVSKDSKDRDNIHCQIDASKSYMGMEPDGMAYPHLKVFNLDKWEEDHIWKSILGWIAALAD